MSKVIIRPSLEDDVTRIQDWTDKDEYHRGQNSPRWWLTGNGLLSFCAQDDEGPLFYVRVDDGEYYRLSVQFAPREIVGKKRLIPAMLQVLPVLIKLAEGKKGLVFDSISPSLIRFMSKVGFKEENGSFILKFELPGE